MKKEFIEKVLKHGEVTTKKFKYVAERREYDGIACMAIDKYGLDGVFIDCVRVVELEENSPDIRTENTEESSFSLDCKGECVDYSSLTEKELTERTFTAIENMAKNFLEISALLHAAKVRLSEHKTVYIEGTITGASCTDIYDYGKRNFGFSRGTVSDYINIAERFLIKETEGGTAFPRIKEKYEGYSVSQLQALLPIKDEQWIDKHVAPQNTVREIKSLSKEWKESIAGESDNSADTTTENPVKETETGATVEDNPVEDEPAKVIKEYLFRSFDEYNLELDKLDSKISKLLKNGKKVSITLMVS